MPFLCPSRVLVTIFLSICLTAFTSASSAQRPLKRISHPSTLAIEIYPRTTLSHSSPNHARAVPPDSTTLHHSDSFRLTLTAFGETFHLHLRPNDQLVHPSARIVYYDTNPAGQSVLSHTEPLVPSSIKAYWGEVVPAHASAERMRIDAARALYSAGDILGWARITVHDQGDAHAGRPPVFEGAFSVRGINHHVLTRDSYLRNRDALDPHPLTRDLDSDPDGGLVIWRDSDVMDPWEEHAARMDVPVDYLRERRSLGSESEAVRCGHDALPWNSDPVLNPVLQQSKAGSWYNGIESAVYGSTLTELLTKRDDIAGSGMSTNFANNIGQTIGCPKEQKVLYMGVAADCEYRTLTKQILTIWNTASVLYKNTFNVSLGIVELQIQNSTCPKVADPALPWNINCSTPNVALDDRLSAMTGAGLWHLMSNCPTGSEVGIAWLGTLCQVNATGSGSSIVSGAGVSTSGLIEWQVIAHEIGHNFGAIHDCADGCNNTSACCPLSASSCNADSKFLMSPVALQGEMSFSQCTVGNVCSLMQGSTANKVDTSCLLNPDPSRQTISLQMCGNGIVESGEDCDPGKGSNSTCCDPNTCKFRNNAVCDPDSTPCCTGQCRFAPATQVCRASRDTTCDTAELCTGNSSACPADIFAPNGRSCGTNDLTCASGQCTSISQQCQQLGTSLNLQSACPNRNDRSCKVSCQDPTTPNQCVQLDSLLIDGSPCGYGGTCLNGTCQSGSAFDTAKAWYVQNLQISIPITVAAALLVLAVLWGIIKLVGLRTRVCQSRVSRAPALIGRGNRPVIK
ncbi:Metallo-peptidase family M12-domain-containing protein [Lactarius sanguifluus]|nr:Metallo-peptidase family M12-domain-containing protein [Lactarius sanguifluus]